ncbi:MAG: hypothetical protein Q9217_003991 [Psora testacea]
MTSAGHKRPRQSADQYPSLYPNTSRALSFTSTPHPTSACTNNHSNSSTSSSSFRNVSACNRCRIRKNRCDQNLPACSTCEKAGAKCVGFDPITKREIPRTYVYYLESRVNYLEDLLIGQGICYEPSTEFDLGSKPVSDEKSATAGLSPRSEREHVVRRARSTTGTGSESGSEWEAKHEENEKINKLVSNIGMVSVQGASDPRYLGSTSGISFARVVAAAIKSSVPDKIGRGSGSRHGSIGATAAATSGTSMRDSFFGLQAKPSIKPAPFPDKELGMKLVDLYFEYANPQIPILHKGDFMILFGRAYQSKDRQRSPRELYMLNIVFAIGAGIILEDTSSGKNSPEGSKATTVKQEPLSPSFKRQKMSNLQKQPEEYHASAMVHLESFLGSMPAADRPEGFGGGLEQLQAVLLLASFALLRPVAPGLWYITGVAVRLGIDLGLHYEDGAVIDDAPGQGQTKDAGTSDPHAQGIDSIERGRREWIRDLRRRLWWCVYSFDRLVSTCVGRPFGIADQVVTTDWPSVLDDKDITPEGFLIPSHNFNGPSYKRVSHHYFRFRLLQSEILQVLQYRQAKRVHEKDRERSNQYMHTKLSSSFLQPFGGSFHAWRKDIDRRLWEWKESAPLQQDTTVRFSIRFLELNYWQAVIMLYRQSLSVPSTFAGERGPHNEIETPLNPGTDDYEEEDEIFLKVAEAGQRVLKLYRQLHKAHVVNYTYLATVHLFMAGIAFLYSVWHSDTTIEDVNYTVLAGISVLTDLIDKCPPAEACRDAFDRMSKATITMCQTTTGFGSQVKWTKDMQDDSPVMPHGGHLDRHIPPQPAYQGARPTPTLDYSLKDLFSDQTQPTGPLFSSGSGWQHLSSKPGKVAQLFPYPSSTSTSSGSMPTSNPSQMASTQHQPRYDPRLFAQQPFQPATSANLSSSATSSPGPFNYPTTDFLQTPEFDFMLQDTSTSDSSAPYTNLGFEGGQHDFDDGAQNMPDLFGGFFFGGPVGQDSSSTPFTGMDGITFGDSASAGESQDRNGWGGHREDGC